MISIVLWAGLALGQDVEPESGAQDTGTAPEEAAGAEPPSPWSDDDLGDEVVVEAEGFQAPLSKVPISMTVIEGRELEQASIVHAEDALRMTPNVDWVGIGSRPRYLLIRGVGDLGTGQLVTNPTVGVIVDDVDLSGVGAALATLDVDRFELLRGPQGTLVGSNALGGVMRVQSRAPSAVPELRAGLRLGTYHTRTAWITASGSVLKVRPERLTFRAAAQVHQDRGPFTNDTVGRDDTAGRRELATRLRMRWIPADQVTVDVIGAYVDLDNGYDHWTIDDSRTTLTDRPGLDAQRTGMGSVRVVADSAVLRFTSVTSGSVSGLRNEADYDWIGVNTRPRGSQAPDDYVVDLYGRNHTRQDALTQELRLQSRQGAGPWQDRVRWQSGLHLFALRQLRETGLDIFGEPFELAANEATYRRLSAAAFGQIDVSPVERLTLTAGLRGEAAVQDYRDLVGINDTELRPLLGWRLAARVDVARPVSVFVAGSQGQKLGGFNLDPSAPLARYLPETARSLEVGVRARGWQGRVQAGLTGFYTWRLNHQVTEWIQRPGGDSADIFFYTDNAERARATGFEADLRVLPLPWLAVVGSLGVLDARIQQWTFNSGADTVDYSGNVHAHAPPWQYAVGLATQEGVPVDARVDVQGSAARQMANNNLIEAPPYHLLHLRLGVRGRQVGVALWSRNLLDARVAQAGFGPFFTPNAHVPAGTFFRYGDRASFGVELTASL